MSEVSKTIRLSKAAKEFNVGITRIVEFLEKKGFSVDTNPNTKLSQELIDILEQEFSSDQHVKEESRKIGIGDVRRETISMEDKPEDDDIVDDDEKVSEELFIKGVTSDFLDIKTDVDIKETKKEIPLPVAKKIEIKDEVKPDKKEEKKEEESEKVVKKDQKTTDSEIAEKEKPEQKEKIEDQTISDKKTVEKTKITDKTKKEQVDKKQKIGEKEITEVEKSITDKEEPKDTEPKHKIEDESKSEKVPQKKTIEEGKDIKEKEVDRTVKDTKILEEPESKEKTDQKADNFIPTQVKKLSVPKILDKIQLPVEKKSFKKPVASSKDEKVTLKKKKRKRIAPLSKKDHIKHENLKPTVTGKTKTRGKRFKKDHIRPEVSEEEIQKQIRETLSRLSPAGKSKASKHRRHKRAAISQSIAEEEKKIAEEKKFIKVTEFVTVNELATMMSASVNDVISACMSLGLFVSINQRLDAETLTVVAEEFEYKVEFVSVDVQEAIHSYEDDGEPDFVSERSPIITVMGHVDHGKTKLLDHIRNTNVIAGEAGGITQHIGAYEVILENENKITFLDTPGHEAFTAMRARGAKVTDVAIIVIAADDNVMPQTKEAINHAQAAGVPIIFAINKIDKANSNPDKIKQELADMNILLEDWGGKYQSQDISAKMGDNIDLLLEKVFLEAEMLELKGNPKKLAIGTVIESSLDKGRGFVAKVLVQNGTLRVGDMVLAGSYFGKVKAMYNERNKILKEAGPSTPLLMLGLNGAPQAGDSFNVMRDEKEAKAIAFKRQQLQREQGQRTQKHITLDEIGRRIAIGDFKELNLIVKGDVDGSIEALSDSLLKLSTEEIQVNVIHQSVGAITESDVLLASASNAIIVGFQVRPSPAARKLAGLEQIDIRLYSIIYQAIEEIRSAIEGMLSPEIEEKITSNIEIREVFKITKVGTIAGCYVLDGKINRNSKVRVIRDGIVVYTGLLGSLKRFKDDVKEVAMGYECGLNIENFNDVKVGDIIEGYEEVEIQRKL